MQATWIRTVIDDDQQATRPIFSFWHLGILLVIWFPLNPTVILGGYMLLRDRLLLYLYTVVGPFIDIVGRGPTSVRWTEAWIALALFGTPLIVAFSLQLFWRPQTSIGQVSRLFIWAIGWFSWFFGAAIMMGRAMG